MRVVDIVLTSSWLQPAAISVQRRHLGYDDEMGERKHKKRKKPFISITATVMDLWIWGERERVAMAHTLSRISCLFAVYQHTPNVETHHSGVIN